jgi:DNA sulfur modification protein DndB
MKTSMTSATSETRPSRPTRTRRQGVDTTRFVAIRAVQAGRAYFITACPLRLVPELLSFDTPDLPARMRAQRVLNKARVPQITRYLTSNPTSYVLSALTASIDGDVMFEPLTSLEEGCRLGELVIARDARVLVNDGQHRRAAIAEALKTMPELGHESVPLVLFLDAGLARSQQVFADLNRHVVRPTRSLNILYDHRDRIATLARRVASEVCPFAGLTELEKSSLSNRSSDVFTLSGVHQATAALLRHRRNQEWDDRDETIVLQFWEIVGQLILGWGFIGEARTAAELRRDFIHSHAVALHALGTVAGELVVRHPRNWRQRLKRLSGLDWSRLNPVWEGRALRNGRISKAGPSLILTANVLRAGTGLPLSATELALEATVQEDRRVAA